MAPCSWAVAAARDEKSARMRGEEEKKREERELDFLFFSIYGFSFSFSFKKKINNKQPPDSLSPFSLSLSPPPRLSPNRQTHKLCLSLSFSLIQKPSRNQEITQHPTETLGPLDCCRCRCCCVPVSSRSPVTADPGAPTAKGDGRGRPLGRGDIGRGRARRPGFPSERAAPGSKWEHLEARSSGGRPASCRSPWQGRGSSRP